MLDQGVRRPPVHPDRRPRGTLWALRVIATLHAVAVIAQPILIGSYLSGTYSSLSVHALVGSVLAAIALAQAAVAGLWVLVGRGRLWLLPVTAAMFLIEGLQIGMGYARTMQVHVPLGVALVLSAVLLCGWSWTARAARPRSAANPKLPDE